MNVFLSLMAVVVLVLLAWFGAGTAGLEYLFGIIIPYAAIALFLLGVIYRILIWAKAPVPFRITTTCGQQKSLPWIKSSKLESPHSLFGVLGRMALEILFFGHCSVIQKRNSSTAPGWFTAPASGFSLEGWLFTGVS